MEAIVTASQICDEFGIDTMSSGITIGFAMECFEKGLIDTKITDGIELRFGNHEAMIAMLRKIVKQEGFGRELAKGTKNLSEQIKGSEKFAMHVKGLELGGYECRGLTGQALQFAVNSNGGSHAAFGLPARVEVLDNSRFDVTGKGEYVKMTATKQIVRDCSILCSFAPVYSNETMLARILSSLFEEPWSFDELRKAAARIMCQERLFNMREGITRKDDALPVRLLNEPAPTGPAKGKVVPLEELKDDFYRAMEYDLSTGNPTEEVLSKLGIER